MKPLLNLVQNYEIYRSILNCHYVAKNCSKKLTIHVKQSQSIVNIASSPLCIQIALFERNRSSFEPTNQYDNAELTL